MINFKNEIWCGKAEVLLNHIPEESFDLTICSPPYNVDLGHNKFRKKGYDLYKDNKEHKEYIDWLEDIFRKVYLKTKEGGRCVINVGDGKNGSVPTHSDIIQMMVHKLKWLPITTIIWDKGNTSNRAAWGSWLSPSCPSFPRGFEFILVFAKTFRKLQWKGETDLLKKEFINWTNGIWKFSGKTNPICPAAFPEELPKRCIKMFSWIGAMVADPFIGSGTTAIAANNLRRNYWGCDISERYVKESKRLLHPRLEV